MEKPGAGAREDLRAVSHSAASAEALLCAAFLQKLVFSDLWTFFTFFAFLATAQHIALANKPGLAIQHVLMSEKLLIAGICAGSTLHCGQEDLFPACPRSC